MFKPQYLIVQVDSCESSCTDSVFSAPNYAINLSYCKNEIKIKIYNNNYIKFDFDSILDSFLHLYSSANVKIWDCVRKANLRSSQSKGLETARLDRSCGKNKITIGREDHRKPKPVTLDGEEHRKPITEFRKHKPVTLDGEEHRKPITEFRKTKPVTLDGEEHRKHITEHRKPKPVTLDGEGLQETHHWAQETQTCDSKHKLTLIFLGQCSWPPPLTCFLRKIVKQKAFVVLRVFNLCKNNKYINITFFHWLKPNF